MSDSLFKIFEWKDLVGQGTKIGTIVSPFYEYYDSAGQFTWAADVDIGTDEPLRNVPVATTNRNILYAQEGMPVTLEKIGKDKWAITGVSKKVISDTHIISVCFQDDAAVIVDEQVVGFYTRPLTYEELNTYGGYGVVPYGTRGRFNAQGTLLYLLPTY